ncbi:MULTISPECIES: hypothetical protein [unclassified Streptomyces]|uniref:hypothetical protein n=1 Tax=unclassified Streptomyces TaxID=2593676 RepID=UPI00093DB96A|nr:hypothetical protein [Streptomyces sp. TSRI0281]OKI41267.1 hypothetical protein A6A29_38025 [Streptomyces sp. TSRI0281]
MSAEFDKIAIWMEFFIPTPTIEALGECFHGDGRDFSPDPNEQRFRARSDIVVTGFLAEQPGETDFHQCGESQKLDCATGEVLATETASTDAMSFHHFSVGNTFPDPEGGVIDNPNEFCVNFLYDGAAINPLAPPGSPAADLTAFFTIDPVGRTVSVRGATNAYPDYEAYASVDDGEPVVLFQQKHSLGPVEGLPGPADQPFSATVSV